MKKRITLKHIAKEFNVSIVTVSKALKDSHEISTATKAKIQKYAKAHHYRPNRIALSLLNNKTKTIGVLIPNIMNTFFTKVFVGIEKKADEFGYQLITCISNESYEKEVKTMALLRSGALDGFILSIAEETEVKQDFEHFKEAIDEGIPIVMFDRVTDTIECDKVIVDDFEGAFNATDLLLKSGCKRIALISVIDNLSVGKLRVEGYKKALIENHIDIEEKLIVRIEKNESFDICLKIVLADKSIDGLLCLEESSAIEAHRLVKSMGYKIPEEMSIICFTNGNLPKHVTPAITTISQHGKHIGEVATKTLIERLESHENKAYTTQVIKTSLLERETTRKLK